MSRGVVITGSGRSGTSMVAGLFAAHGVFFGDCKPADKYNARGYFEHPSLPLPKAKGKGWPRKFWRRLRREGWDGVEPWGIKHITTRWRWFRALNPTVVVLTVRPKKHVLKSLRRTGWQKRPRLVFKRYRKRLKRIHREATCPVVVVSASALVDGDYTQIRGAFKILGVSFDPAIADAWIDRSLWGANKP